MYKLFILLLSTFLFAQSPFETAKERRFDLSIFDTSMSKQNKRVSQNDRVRCRYVCDKKIYKEQKIADAIFFYKNSKDYNISSE